MKFQRKLLNARTGLTLGFDCDITCNNYPKQLARKLKNSLRKRPKKLSRMVGSAGSVIIHHQRLTDLSFGCVTT